MVPLWVERVELATRTFKPGTLDEDHVRGAWVTMFIYGGLPAGRRITRFWSWRYAKFIRVAVGFSRWDRSRFTDDRKRLKTNFPFIHMRQLAQFRLLAELEADFDPSGPKLVGDQVRATPSMIAHNHKILRMRLRRDGFECPKNWDRECHFCPVGYANCPAACHRADYVGRHCPACGQDNRPFDPESPAAHCVDCSG